MTVEKVHQDYDDEPVVYCSRCYSLKIRYEEAIDSDCCMECGCSDILSTSIENWERLYEKRYGKKYTEKNKDPRSSFIFTLTIQELKDKVYQDNNWNEIIRHFYPRFPRGLSRADSVILFFDRMIKDNRMDQLRLYFWEKEQKNNFSGNK